MKNEEKNFFNKSKILKLLLISPFLVSIPFFSNSEVNAGLEFQWDQNSGFRRLKWLQKNNRKGFRNTIYFFLRPFDRKVDLLKISIKIPKNFKSTIKEEKVSLCKVKIGGFETRTKCLEDIPADIELNEDKTSLNIFPYTPIASNKESYAVVLKVFNPRKSGLFQFHTYGQYVGNDSVSSYLGSSTLVID